MSEFSVSVVVKVTADCEAHAAALGWQAVRALSEPTVYVNDGRAGVLTEIDLAARDASRAQSAESFLSDLFYAEDCDVCGGDEQPQYHYALVDCASGTWRAYCVQGDKP